MDMRQREQALQFRTPQHPSLGTNHWGGASPLLARNIPEECLEQRYLRLNSIRTRNEIFRPLEDDDDFFYVSKIEASKYECPPTPRRKGLIWKLIWLPRKDSNPTLGSLSNSKKKRMFPKLDRKKRWPNGWC